jgi:transmembrane sensor
MTDMKDDAVSTRRRSVAEEAADWLAMCSDPAASAEERAAFVAWLRRSNLHVEEFLRLSALTQRLGSKELWPSESAQELIARARENPQVAQLGVMGSSARPSGPDHTSRWPAGAWALATCIVLGIAGALLLWLRPEILGLGGDTYTTAVGEMRSITLPDGSVVELNTQSSLRTRFDERVRRVELVRGEAIFRVARDRARPFQVVTGATEIVAVGTAFNVYAEQSRTVVTVLEGRVRVTDGLARAPVPEIELGSGEQAVIAPRQPIARVTLADASRVTSWTERRLIFEDATLAAVCEEFARYSPRLIRIDDATLAQRQITGVFDATDPASLVQFLGAQGDVAIAETTDGWSLRTR